MPRIDEIYAWVAVDDGGPLDEGITGYLSPQGWLPMVGADKARIESLRPFARAVAARLGKPVKLIRFSTRTVIEELAPRKVD